MVKLRIEAGAAFGTGHHATTWLCLAALDAALKRSRPQRALDLGTGTGILAIAAARAGARVVGVDNDPIAVRVGRENAALNGAACRFAVAYGPAPRLVRLGGPYDLIFANILAEPVIRLALPIRRLLAPRGLAILSGLLRGQRRAVLAARHARGLRLHKVLVRDAWAYSIMSRQGGAAVREASGLKVKLHRDHAEHAAREDDVIISRASLTIAILAVLAAIVGIMESVEGGLATTDASRAVLAQVQATDSWSFYQAKSVKKRLDRPRRRRDRRRRRAGAPGGRARGGPGAGHPGRRAEGRGPARRLARLQRRP